MCWLEAFRSTITSWGTIFVALAVCAAVYARYLLTYWKRQGVDGLPPSVPFGSIADTIMQRRTFGEVFKDIYDVMKAKGRMYAGAYSFFRPIFVPIHPDHTKSIMQRGFAHFTDRGFYVNEKTDPLTGNLFTLGYHKWRFLRTKLTPTFTTGKMKMMFYILAETSGTLVSVIDQQLDGGAPVDIKDVLSRFNTDVISSCAFGIACNSLNDPKTQFRVYAEKVFAPRISGLFELAIPHHILRMVGFRTTPKDIEAFFRGLVEETVKQREEQKVERKDFMQLLMQLKNQGYVLDDAKSNVDTEQAEREKITMNELIAQCFVFFLAGYETSSTTASFALYELAINEDIQNAAREEINDVLDRRGGKITYDAIMQMVYLDKIVYETLRKYPPVPVLNRICTKDYPLPNTSVVIREGTLIFIPILGMHYDPELYPEPEEFKPDRFDDDFKLTRTSYTWLPFGAGPRVCIAQRFAMIQVKMAIVAVLRNFRITCNEKTTTPLQFEPTAFILAAKGGIWLNMERIT